MQHLSNNESPGSQENRVSRNTPVGINVLGYTNGYQDFTLIYPDAQVSSLTSLQVKDMV